MRENGDYLQMIGGSWRLQMPRQITQIPLPGGSGRVPTGAMQFQDDWPGLFIRGDSAVPLMVAIRRVQAHLQDCRDVGIASALFVLGSLGDAIDRDVVVRQGVQPVMRYMILCEDVQTDVDNPNRISLIGLITAIRSLAQPSFPILYPEICVFLQLTGCRGAADGKIEIQHADSGQVVFRTRTRTISFGSDPLEVVGIVFRIRNCLFQVEGLYWVQFCYNEVMIAQQALLIR
jgi:hypothetical protein